MEKDRYNHCFWGAGNNRRRFGLDLAGSLQMVGGYLGLLGFILLAILINPERLVNNTINDEHGEE